MDLLVLGILLGVVALTLIVFLSSRSSAQPKDQVRRPVVCYSSLKGNNVSTLIVLLKGISGNRV